MKNFRFVKESAKNWLFRVNHLFVLCLAIIVLGNLVYAAVSKDVSKIKGFFDTTVDSTILLGDKISLLSPLQQANLVLLLLTVTIGLMLFQLHKKMLYYVTIGILAIILAGLVILKHDFWNTVVYTYLNSYDVVMILGGLISISVFWNIGTLKVGRMAIWKTIKTLFYTAITFGTIYYLVTFNFVVIYRTLQLFWGETVFGFDNIAVYMDMITLSYIGFILAFRIFFLITSKIYNVKRKKETKLRGFTADVKLPKVGVTVPAFKEKEVINPTVETILNSDYPKGKLDVLVVCDGSPDGTDKVLIERFKMVQVPYREPYLRWVKTEPILSVWQSQIHPNLRMIYKKNGGKFDALNTGIKYHHASCTHLVHLDADTKLESTAIRKLAEEMVRDKEIYAAAGMIIPTYEPFIPENFKEAVDVQFKKGLVTWQKLDYFSSFHVSRGSLGLFNTLMIISGAFGMFNRMKVFSLFGYRKSLGEDMDFTLKIQVDNHNRKSGKTAFVPEALSYTAAPLTLRELRSQRVRWFKGLMECIQNFNGFFNPKMLLGFLEFTLIEFISPLLAPLGILMVAARPEILSTWQFQVCFWSLISVNFLNTMVGYFIEKTYRKTEKKMLLYLPFQVLMIPFTLLWRNDGFIDFGNKKWGDIRKTFH